MIFANAADADQIKEGDSFIIRDFRKQLAAGSDIICEAGGREIKLKCELNARDLEIILAGGLLNL